ncbi:TIGR03564 family F420-dependent LLM class oxidoreductase [Mycobacterium sp. Aquia_216]|uniref:TIGR03564 family F420-dependent LLM class oxidoreductase n=1 Tax=Mycobacterium sp. Aquia_216 TaxID=2991729 RepID=UPI00227D241D|nr:TIGR03564 family F420-dependent LLM class oxidoreductase [Mycobacterium sp. Aquia_216]WAJ47703.1 TIGR03564 family F420-dependent LLM class oxidoreductase [Mycobacterium sp. Aquia_216]
MEISVFTSLGDGDGPTVVNAYIDEVARVSEEGFSRMWTAQLPWETDLLGVQAVALREVPDIELGVGVLPIQVAHPMLTAQRALTLSALSGGRFTLGLGVAHPSFSEDWWGIPWEKPVRRMIEYLDGVLPLLTGEEVNATGQFVTTYGSLQVSNVPAPQVYIAAMGPQMLRVAARRTAGTFTWMTGPRTLAEHIGPTLREAAAAAGRPEGAVKVLAGLPVCVTDDANGARARAAEQFAIYGTLPTYRAMLDREGAARPEEIALIGDEAAVADRIDEIRTAGVDEFAAYPFGDGDETRARTLALLRKVAETSPTG